MQEKNGKIPQKVYIWPLKCCIYILRRFCSSIELSIIVASFKDSNNCSDNATCFWDIVLILLQLLEIDHRKNGMHNRAITQITTTIPITTVTIVNSCISKLLTLHPLRLIYRLARPYPLATVPAYPIPPDRTRQLLNLRHIPRTANRIPKISAATSWTRYAKVNHRFRLSA